MAYLKEICFNAINITRVSSAAYLKATHFCCPRNKKSKSNADNSIHLGISNSSKGKYWCRLNFDENRNKFHLKTRDLLERWLHCAGHDNEKKSTSFMKEVCWIECSWRNQTTFLKREVIPFVVKEKCVDDCLQCNYIFLVLAFKRSIRKTQNT